MIENFTSLYLDSNIYIYFLEKNKEFYPITRLLFDKIQLKNKKVVASVLIFGEIIQNQKALKNSQRVYNFLTEFNLIDVNIAITKLSAQLTVQNNVRTIDSIHLATAINQKCDVFITNDKKIKSVKEIKVLQLSDLKI